MRSFCLYILTLSLVACGFHLRGNNEFHYKTIAVSGQQTQINQKLIKSLKTNQVQVVSDVTTAEMQIELLKEENEKRILSLSGDGKVNEYELYYRIHYRTKSAQDLLWSQPQTMEARRDFSYTDANLLAKQSEEKQLNESMQHDVLNGIMRRLSVLKK